ncbi:MAG TPA: ATP-binding cassette domain-containing protein, partial [Candidatus Thalassarchaeaceae archaeon]|nr:ATP-binding cassette domain-containing protein [Candidatus Thalassarchaeaceae archaeon]
MHIRNLGRTGMLRVTNLRKGFGSGRRRLEVLKGVNLELAPGELVSMMGPSGCGKSTLLNVIGGLLEADSGTISL